MSIAECAQPISDDECKTLFAGLERARAVVLAVSGGPDSTALLLLAARWRHTLGAGPALLAVTVDHALRPEARAEALAVKRLAKQCGVAHRILRWNGPKPKSGLQQAARAARYRLLAEMAVRFGADNVLTAHTRDDQAETVLIRMSRGSGLAGLAGMTRQAPLPAAGPELTLVRPFIDIAKARLLATLDQAGIVYADDPSNRDPRFTRSRVRALLPELAREGLDARRLVQLARRLRRADAALVAIMDAAWNACVTTGNGVSIGQGFDRLPAEIQIRLLGRAIDAVGNEGPVELGKLEALHEALTAAMTARRGLRRTLAGALVTLAGGSLTTERAPARRLRQAARRPAENLNQGQTLPPRSGRPALQ